MKSPFAEMGKSVGGIGSESDGERSAAHSGQVRFLRGASKDMARYTNLKFKGVVWAREINFCLQYRNYI